MSQHLKSILKMMNLPKTNIKINNKNQQIKSKKNTEI